MQLERNAVWSEEEQERLVDSQLSIKHIFEDYFEDEMLFHDVIEYDWFKIHKEDKVIGEFSGYLINDIDFWNANKQSLFFAMDGYSQLLCNLHELLFDKILKKIPMDTPTSEILFLNRVDFYNNEEVFGNLVELLSNLQNHFDAIVFSYGSTELMDKDFYDNGNGEEVFEKVENEILIPKNGWKSDELAGFYFYIKDAKKL